MRTHLGNLVLAYAARLFYLVELAARGFDIHTGFDEMVEALLSGILACPVAARGRSRGSMTQPNGQV